MEHPAGPDPEDWPARDVALLAHLDQVVHQRPGDAAPRDPRARADRASPRPAHRARSAGDDPARPRRDRRHWCGSSAGAHRPPRPRPSRRRETARLPPRSRRARPGSRERDRRGPFAGSRKRASRARAARWANPGRTRCRRRRSACRFRRNRAGSTSRRAACPSACPQPRASATARRLRRDPAMAILSSSLSWRNHAEKLCQRKPLPGSRRRRPVWRQLRIVHSSLRSSLRRLVPLASAAGSASHSQTKRPEPTLYVGSLTGYGRLIA